MKTLESVFTKSRGIVLLIIMLSSCFSLVESDHFLHRLNLVPPQYFAAFKSLQVAGSCISSCNWSTQADYCPKTIRSTKLSYPSQTQRRFSTSITMISIAAQLEAIQKNHYFCRCLISISHLTVQKTCRWSAIFLLKSFVFGSLSKG